jgi:16S rRNA (guanine527-N7)-methyltransferase
VDAGNHGADMIEPTDSVASRLSELLASAHLEPLESSTADKFAQYFVLLRRWNARMNLTAVRDEDGILSRHFIESIACAQFLPAGIATLLDLGSGAGFPGIPIALCRPEITVTLAESQGKKAAFLQEVVRTLGLSARVHSGRAEVLSARFDCVALRAVDRMQEAVHLSAGMVSPGGWLAVMTSIGELDALKTSMGVENSWRDPQPLPGSENRILALYRVGLPSHKNK